MKKNKNLDFIKAAIKFTANLRTTGALFQTSKKTERNIAKLIKIHKPKVIVEYGAGLGNITKTILDHAQVGSKLYVFEINSDFCEILRQIKDDRLIVINDSAKNINSYINEEVEIIISTIPFTLISKHELNDIIKISSEKLSNKGIMCQILYSNFFVNKLKPHFNNVSYRMLLSIPVEFFYVCTKSS